MLSEVAYSVSLGYLVLELSQALIYTSLEPIFKSYMTFLASRKIRYSKIPESAKDDLQGYCRFLNQTMQFEDADDILSPEILTPNSAQCQYFKNLANFSLGKISQQGNKTVTEFVDSENRMTEIFCDSTLNVKSCFMLSDTMAQVSFERYAEDIKVSKKTVLTIGAQITSYSRQFLDEHLRLLLKNESNRLGYVDTDSILWKRKRADPILIKEHESCSGYFGNELKDN